MKKATRTHTKLHNRRLVLQTIYDDQPLSRADIARLTHLTATTVSNVVQDLMDEGLVQEVGSVSTGRGKPATLLSLADSAFFIIGVDLGRRAFQGAVINLQGKIVHRASVPSNGFTGNQALALVFELIDKLQIEVPGRLLGIGIGTPGIINPDLGIAQKTVNFGWYDLPLQGLVQERYQVPVRVANDCHLAVLAEYRFGRYKNQANLVLIRLGHGVGAGLILNGELVHGHGFAAGEIGHIVLVDDGEPCSCGNNGCLETIASSRAVIKQAQTILNSEVEQNQASHLTDDIASIVQAAKQGDRRLDSIIEEVGHYLGIALAQIVGILNIPCIALGGSVAQFGDPLIRIVRAEMGRRLIPDSVEQVQIHVSDLEPDIVLLGAAALLLKYELGLV
ncbi:MAG: ROK family transcriptional regulator [Chloroflexota bacterium]